MKAGLSVLTPVLSMQGDFSSSAPVTILFDGGMFNQAGINTYYFLLTVENIENIMEFLPVKC